MNIVTTNYHNEYHKYHYRHQQHAYNRKKNFTIKTTWSEISLNNNNLLILYTVALYTLWKDIHIKFNLPLLLDRLHRCLDSPLCCQSCWRRRISQWLSHNPFMPWSIFGLNKPSLINPPV